MPETPKNRRKDDLFTKGHKYLTYLAAIGLAGGSVPAYDVLKELQEDSNKQTSLLSELVSKINVVETKVTDLKEDHERRLDQLERMIFNAGK